MPRTIIAEPFNFDGTKRNAIIAIIPLTRRGDRQSDFAIVKNERTLDEKIFTESRSINVTNDTAQCQRGTPDIGTRFAVNILARSIFF